MIIRSYLYYCVTPLEMTQVTGALMPTMRVEVHDGSPSSTLSSPSSSRQSSRQGSLDLSRQSSLERKRAQAVELARKNSIERQKADNFSKVFMAPWTTSTQRAQETAALRSHNLVQVVRLGRSD